MKGDTDGYDVWRAVPVTVDILKLVQILLSHILQYFSTKMNHIMSIIRKRYQLSYDAVVIIIRIECYSIQDGLIFETCILIS